jgi:hypothetical protein
MALSFLSDFLGQAAPVAKGIGGLLDAFGVGRPKMNYGPTASEAQANSLFQALLDPNNSLVRQNTDINMQRGMQDLLMQLKLMQMQGARGQARGIRNTFFNPERADETISYLTSRALPSITQQARTQATNDIRSAAESLKGFGDMEQKRSDAMHANRDRDYSTFKTAGGYGGMADRFGGGLQDLFKVLMPQQKIDTMYGTQQPLPWLR